MSWPVLVLGGWFYGFIAWYVGLVKVIQTAAGFKRSV